MTLNLDSNPRNADWSKKTLDADIDTPEEFEVWCHSFGKSGVDYLRSPAGINLLRSLDCPLWLKQYAVKLQINWLDRKGASIG